MQHFKFLIKFYIRTPALVMGQSHALTDSSQTLHRVPSWTEGPKLPQSVGGLSRVCGGSVKVVGSPSRVREGSVEYAKMFSCKTFSTMQ